MPGGATYGASADFNKFSVDQLRYVNVGELRQWRADDRKVLLLDVRNDTEFATGTIPGATQFSQASLFLNWEAMKPQIHQLAATAVENELILFANTGGREGPSASRDLYVLNFLAEMGISVERMVRLQGGLGAWKEAGYAVADPPKPTAANSLAAMLEESGLGHLMDPLTGQSLEHLMTINEVSRGHLLDLLKGLGLKLPERQKVANAISRTIKRSA